MALCDNWVPKNDFTSYEDFHSRYEVNYPENFNFGFDCVDEIARTEPEKDALVWCNPKGEEKRVTFADMREYSNRAANWFKSLGVNVLSLDALKLAAEAGSIKAINTVLLGVLARVLGWEQAKCVQALTDTVKPRFLEMNKAAFDKGYSALR